MTALLEREAAKRPEDLFPNIIRAGKADEDPEESTPQPETPTPSEPAPEPAPAPEPTPSDPPPQEPEARLRRGRRKAAALLAEAANVLETHGWVQGRLADHRFPHPGRSGSRLWIELGVAPDSRHANAFCVLGAVERVATLNGYSRRTKKRALSALDYAAHLTYGTSAVRANDVIMRGKGEAIALLEAARKKV